MTGVRGRRGRVVRLLASALLAVLLLSCAGPGGGPAGGKDLAVEAIAGGTTPVAPGPAAAAPEATEPPPRDGDMRAQRTTAPPPEPPASRARVQAEAQAMLAGLLERRDGEQVVVLVVDEHGREIVAHDPDVAVLPASTLKVVTAAAALITFGPQARFTTRIESTAPIDADGVIRGDLHLIGTGDPVLATPEYGRWIYPARPRTPFESLAEQLAAAGVQRIEGDVVGLVEGFDGPRVADGWPDRYFSSFDARYAEGLAVDAGVRTIVTYPEEEDEEGDGGDGQDTAEDGATDADAGDRAEEPTGPPDVRIEHTREPAEHAVAELVRLLEEVDIEVAGAARVGDPTHTPVGRIATVSSPPLEEILRFAVQRSDNQVTDALFRAVGRQRTGTGSFASGERALEQVLEGLGIDPTQAVFADGSGLSRDDRLTARMLVDLDRAMLRSRHAPTWRSLMAVMGESGTLSSRLSGTVASGRFEGKTGTLRDVAALSGTVIGPDTRRYHLAVIANAQGQARWLSRAFVDELILLLAADLQGCELRSPAEDADDGPLGRPPVRISC